MKNYTSFTIQQAKWEGTEPGYPPIFIDNIYFYNLAKKLGKNKSSKPRI